MNASTRPSILVVEDFAPLRISVVQWLQMRFPECVIHGFGSAEEAIEQVRGSRADVVLMDIDLPGMNGLEAVSRIKALAPQTPVVMLTMHDSPVHRLAATSAGAVGYIAKIDMEDRLAPLVEALLEARAGRS